MASDFNELLSKLSGLLDRWADFVDEITDWATGSKTGGPNGDGTYPITDPAGNTNYAKGVNLIIDTVDGPAGEAKTARDEAETARDAAQTAELGAETARDAAQTAESNAEAAEANALQHRDDAQNAENNAVSAVNTRYPSSDKHVIPDPLTVDSNTSGDPGTFAWDDNYLYLKTSTGWTKVPLNAL